MVTTINIIAVRRSIRMAQSVTKVPLSIQRRIWIFSVWPSKLKKITQDKIAERKRNPVATIWASLSPIVR